MGKDYGNYIKIRGNHGDIKLTKMDIESIITTKDIEKILVPCNYASGVGSPTCAVITIPTKENDPKYFPNIVVYGVKTEHLEKSLGISDARLLNELKLVKINK